jgi:hypothetical protein
VVEVTVRAEADDWLPENGLETLKVFVGLGKFLAGVGE